MVGIRNYAFKLGIHFLNAHKHKKMVISSDALMNYMHMKCGAQTISEESTHKNLDMIISKPNTTIKKTSQQLTKISKLLNLVDGLTRNIENNSIDKGS